MKLFGGKVQVKRLPAVQPSAPREEVQVRIMAAGGELAVLSDNATPIRYQAYVELRANTPRGNHYHQKRHERFYLIAGEAALFLKDMASGERERLELKAGDLVTIEPNVAHTFLPGSNGHALEFSPEPFDSADVLRVEPLHS